MKTRRFNLLVVLILVLAAVMVACAPAAEQESPTTGGDEGDTAIGLAPEEPAEEIGEPANAAPTISASGADDYADRESAPLPELEAPAESDAYAESEEGFSDGAGGMGADVAAPETRSDSAGESSAPEPPLATPMPEQQIDEQFQAGLTAGRINDNEDFEEYLQYRRDYDRFVGAETVNDVDVSQRHIIQVTNTSGLPALGATVEFYSGQRLIASLQTPATGLVYFHPLAYNIPAQTDTLTVIASKGQTSAETTVDLADRRSISGITLDVPSAQPPVQLDVMFLIDATGSMSDEIDQLKDNILSISAQIEALPSRPDVRFGMVIYRDRGDTYVTRVTDFTGDIQAFQRELQAVQAAGGGDTPESMNEGLYRAIWDVDWRVENTVSLMFLVADAPPQLNYEQDYDYSQEMVNAASLGIKIIPISSFLDDDFYQQQAEYIFRQMAQFTGGDFIFLTYESQPQSDGEPGRDVSVPEDSYTVEDLDALVVRLVREELAALEGGQQ